MPLGYNKNTNNNGTLHSNIVNGKHTSSKHQYKHICGSWELGHQTSSSYLYGTNPQNKQTSLRRGKYIFRKQNFLADLVEVNTIIFQKYNIIILRIIYHKSDFSLSILKKSLEHIYYYYNYDLRNFRKIIKHVLGRSNPPSDLFLLPPPHDVGRQQQHYWA